MFEQESERRKTVRQCLISALLLMKLTQSMFEHVDLASPAKHSLVLALQLLQDASVVLWLLKIRKCDAGNQMNLLL